MNREDAETMKQDSQHTGTATADARDRMKEKPTRYDLAKKGRIAFERYIMHGDIEDIDKIIAILVELKVLDGAIKHRKS